MDIRNWGIGQIMKLPDWCFGRRFSVIFTQTDPRGGTFYYLHQMSLPDVCVLWEVYVPQTTFPTGTEDALQFSGNLRLSLGDQVPADLAAFEALEPLPIGQYQPDNVLGYGLHLTNIRQPVFAQGRRVVYEITHSLMSTDWINIALVFSGVPKEVPDWLCSV